MTAPLAAGTRHTCGGPVFGKRTAGCPRCDELAAGAPARTLSPSHAASLRNRANQRAMEASQPKHSCAVSGCGPVCTWGDW